MEYVFTVFLKHSIIFLVKVYSNISKSMIVGYVKTHFY